MDGLIALVGAQALVDQALEDRHLPVVELDQVATPPGDLLIRDPVRRQQQPTGLQHRAMRQRRRPRQTDQLYPVPE
jgi:hypothetical protein